MHYIVKFQEFWHKISRCFFIFHDDDSCNNNHKIKKPTIHILWSTPWIVHAPPWDGNTNHQYANGNHNDGSNEWHHKVQVQPFGYPVCQINLTVRIMLAIGGWCQCAWAHARRILFFVVVFFGFFFCFGSIPEVCKKLMFVCVCGGKMMRTAGQCVRWWWKTKEKAWISEIVLYVPLWWLPLLRRTQITIMAIIITRRAATTGTTRFKLDRMMRIVSSAVSSGDSREGAIVPETTNLFCFVLAIYFRLFVFN